MAIINIGLDNYSPQAVDRSEGKIVAGRTVPYDSVAEALAHPRNIIPYRYIGKTVKVRIAGELLEYWWANGTDDEDLILKTVGYTPASNRINFTLTEDGTITLPADTDIVKCRVYNAAGLADFKVGSAAGLDDVISLLELPADKWQIFYCDIYDEENTVTLHVGGITSETFFTFIKA